MTVWITTNCEKLTEIGIPDHLTCLVRNLYARQEATVRAEHGTADWFQIRKGVIKGCILSLCLFKLYADHILRNVQLDEAQTGIIVAGRNINNLKYADDTTLMAEHEEILTSLLIKVKEDSETSGLNSHSQNEDHGIWSHHFMAIDGETMETVRDFIFGSSKTTANDDCSHEIKRCLLV